MACTDISAWLQAYKSEFTEHPDLAMTWAASPGFLRRFKEGFDAYLAGACTLLPVQLCCADPCEPCVLKRSASLVQETGPRPGSSCQSCAQRARTSALAPA